MSWHVPRNTESGPWDMSACSHNLCESPLIVSKLLTKVVILLQKINEFSNMYYYLKNMSDNDKEDSTEDMKEEELRIVETCDTVDSPRDTEINDTTDPFSEACTLNLEENTKTDIEKKPRPTLKLPKIREQLYQNEFPLNDTEHRIQQALEHDYLVQPSNIKVESPKFRPNNLYANSSRLMPMQPDIFLYSPTEESKNFTIDTPTSDISQINLTKEIRSPSVKSGKEICPLTGQEELAEIINDFKNNVFSISEVEKLVMEWKNRNETQQSLKEKQEQLNKMRDEYDKIQQRIKDRMKRPTPFERVKKMFSKSKSKSKYQFKVQSKSFDHKYWNGRSDIKQNKQNEKKTISARFFCLSPMK